MRQRECTIFLHPKTTPVSALTDLSTDFFGGADRVIRTARIQYKQLIGKQNRLQAGRNVMGLVFRNHNDGQAGQRLPFTMRFQKSRYGKQLLYLCNESIADEARPRTRDEENESRIMPPRPEPLQVPFCSKKPSTSDCCSFAHLLHLSVYLSDL